MSSYKIKIDDFDINFCCSDCTDISCSRCHMSNNYANMIKYNKETGRPHSKAYLSIDCDDYNKPMFTIADGRVV